MGKVAKLKLLSEISNVRVIAKGKGIRELKRLVKAYGNGEWRKLKGIARVSLPDGTPGLVAVPWYEANGIGQREHKIKDYL